MFPKCEKDYLAKNKQINSLFEALNKKNFYYSKFGFSDKGDNDFVKVDPLFFSFLLIKQIPHPKQV